MRIERCHTVRRRALRTWAAVNPISDSMAIWSGDGSGPSTVAADWAAWIGSSMSKNGGDEKWEKEGKVKTSDKPGSSMCENSHSTAASASLLPVARSAFWQRIVGNPIPSSWAFAASLNWGIAAAAVSSVIDQISGQTTEREREPNQGRRRANLLLLVSIRALDGSL